MQTAHTFKIKTRMIKAEKIMTVKSQKHAANPLVFTI